MTGSVAGLCDLDSALLTLLPDLSGALLRVSPRQMDAEIEGWLERLVGLLSVDRITLLQMSAEGSGLHSTHSAAATGAPPPFPVVATEGELTWLVQQVRHGRLVQSPDLPRGLPYSAGRERVLVARAGLKSLALVPFAIGGSGLGAMALSSTRAHPAFPDAVMARLELAAQVIGGALARQRTRQTLEARIAFEHLLTDLVASVVGATAIELDTRIQHGLASVIGHLGIDSCSILRFSDDHASLSRTHYATAPGISPIRPAIEFPWYLERVRAGRVTQYTQNVADLPDAAAPEQDYLRERGVQTHVSIPLAAAGRPWGAIGFSAILRPRLWSDEEVQRLGMVGVIVMEALRGRESEQKRHRHDDELAHVARVAALGELTAALAHELNQPLMAIRLNAQATRRLLPAGQPQDLDEVLGDIAADATRAGDLIQRLCALLRRRELAKEVLDVNEVIAAVQGIARAEACRHGAELVVQASPGLPPVVGDEIQLQQVLLNLVRNAAEALSAQPGPREVRIRTWGAPDEHVTISVEDEGPPIDDATLAAMFTPFVTTKAEGLGIGLTISRSIVEAHAGRLWAERRAAGGLAVRFALPARPASEHAALLGHARSLTGRPDRREGAR